MKIHCKYKLRLIAKTKLLITTFLNILNKKNVRVKSCAQINTKLNFTLSVVMLAYSTKILCSVYCCVMSLLFRKWPVGSTSNKKRIFISGCEISQLALLKQRLERRLLLPVLCRSLPQQQLQLISLLSTSAFYHRCIQ